MSASADIAEIERAEAVLDDCLRRAFLDLIEVPFPARYAPRLLSQAWYAERGLRAGLIKVGLPDLSSDIRRRFYQQIDEGQGYDDAMGYKLRCWLAAFDMPFKPAWVSRSALKPAA